MILAILPPFQGRDHLASFLVYANGAGEDPAVRSYTAVPNCQDAEREDLVIEVRTFLGCAGRRWRFIRLARWACASRRRRRGK